MLIVPSNIGPPSAITVVFLAPLFANDLTQVTAISLLMRRQNGTTQALPMVIVSATPGELVAQYVFAGGEISGTGAYQLAPTLTVSGGSLPAETINMFVNSPWAGPPVLKANSYVAVSRAIAPLATQSTSVLNPAALSALVTASLAIGALAYVQSFAAYFSFVPSSVAVPDGVNIIAAQGGGNWLRLATGGAVTSVANGAALTALVTSILLPGALAYVQSRTTLWAYQPGDSSAADGSHIAAHGGGNWVYHSAGNASAAQAQATWRIDPVNGSDDAAGTTVAPVKTGAEIFRRWGTNRPSLTAATTVQWASSAPASDPFVVHPLCTLNGSLLLTYASLTVAQTTTIATFTANNLGTGAFARITAAGIASWAALVGALVHDTTTGATFFIDADLGGGVAEITQPMQTSSVASVFGPTAQAIAVGNTIQIFAPMPSVYMPSTSAETIPGSFQGLTVQGLTITADALIRTSSTVFAECTFTVAVLGSGIRAFGQSFFNSCRFGTAASLSSFQGGGQFFGGSIQGVGSQFEDFVYLDGHVKLPLRFHPQNCYVLIGAAYFGQSAENEDGVSRYVAQASSFGPGGNPAIWGPATWDMSRGSTTNIIQGTAAGVLLVNGGFTLDSVNTGMAFNPATGAFSAAVVITPAAIDGALGKSLQNPATGSRISVN